MRRLETTTDLLDAIQERHGWTSDNQIALRLQIPSATISGWRTGRMYPTETHAFKLAKALGVSPVLVLVIAAADRCSDKKTQAEWREMLRQIARGGVAALAALVVGTATYTPQETSADPSALLRQIRRRASPAKRHAA